jgi:hypothetical protein
MAGKKGMHDRLSTSPSYAEKVRARIRAGGIARMLEDHVVGKRQMTASQVAAGLGLLRKVVPDVSHQELSAPGGGPVEIRWAPAK